MMYLHRSGQHCTVESTGRSIIFLFSRAHIPATKPGNYYSHATLVNLFYCGAPCRNVAKVKVEERVIQWRV